MPDGTLRLDSELLAEVYVELVGGRQSALVLAEGGAPHEEHVVQPFELDGAVDRQAVRRGVDAVIGAPGAVVAAGVTVLEEAE